jgi:hypothetical protein
MRLRSCSVCGDAALLVGALDSSRHAPHCLVAAEALHRLLCWHEQYATAHRRIGAAAPSSLLLRWLRQAGSWHRLHARCTSCRRSLARAATAFFTVTLLHDKC